MGSAREMLEEEAALDKLMLEDKKAGLSLDRSNTGDDPTRKAEGNTQVDTDKQGEEWKKKFEEMEHKYNVLKGKEYAEVPRLQAENSKLSSKIASLERQLSATEAEKKAAQNSAEIEGVYKTLVDELGENATNSIKKVLGGEDLSSMRRKLADSEDKISRLERETKEVRSLTFTDKLSAIVPDWESINVDPKWLVFLEKRVPGSRMVYQDALDDAAAKGDHKVVAEIFNKFKSDSGLVVSKKSRVEDIIEPGPAKPSTPDGDKKVYTKREIDKFYKKIERGVYSDKEARSIESEIDRAYEEGRIIED